MLTDAPPVTTDEVVGRRLTQGAREAQVDVPVVADVGGSSTSRRAHGIVIGIVAAASLLVAGLGVANRSTGDSEPAAVGTRPTSTAAPAAPAPTDDVPPRLLMEDGWLLVEVRDFDVNSRAMSFAGPRGERLQLGWVRDPRVGADASARRELLTQVTSASMLGTTVPVYQVPLPTTVETVAPVPTSPAGGDAESPEPGSWEAVWVSGDSAISVSAEAGHLEGFVAAVESLRESGQSEWDAAVPSALVTEAERPAVVDEMMAEVIVPDGFELTEIRNQPLIQDRMTIGFDLAQAVTCAWLEQWLDAAGNGDDDAIAEALDGLGSISGSQPWVESGSPDEMLPFVNADGTVTARFSSSELEPVDRQFVTSWCGPSAG